jgi:hypothetical protein
VASGAYSDRRSDEVAGLLGRAVQHIAHPQAVGEHRSVHIADDLLG